MKKFLFFKVFVLLVLVSGCNEQNEEIVADVQSWSTIDVIDDIPRYSDMESFLTQCLVSAMMESDQRLKFEESSSFVSLWTLYDVASEEYNGLKSMEEYHEWKARYSGLFVFAEDEDDQAFCLKTKDLIYGYGVDIYGKAIIGDELIDFNEIDNIKEWDSAMPQLKSDRTPIGSVCEKLTSDRKLRCYQKNITVQGGTNCWLVYIAGQKKGIFGWNNYSGGRSIRPVNAVLAFSSYNNSNNEANWANTIYGSPSSPAYFNEKYTWRVYQSSFAQVLSVWTSGVGESRACTL